MSEFQIQNFKKEHIAALMDLQAAYSRKYPGTKVVDAAIYSSADYHEGKDVFCLFHPNGQLLAFATLFPQFSSQDSQSPHIIWADVKADPLLMDMTSIKDQLFESLRRRVQFLMAEYNGHPFEIRFQYLPHEETAVSFIRSKGAQPGMGIYQLERSLKLPIAHMETPSGITVERWKMESTAEQAMYVQARNECFPDTPIRLDAWVTFMQSDKWKLGTQIAAFEGKQLVGSLSAYWNDKIHPGIGYCDDIFVREGWRGRKIAPAMICAGLLFLQEQGLRAARLEVYASNRKALALYEVLGYQIIQESRVYFLRFESR